MDYKMYTRKEEQALFKKYHNGSEEAYHLLIESQLGWGRKLVNNYTETYKFTDKDLLFSAAYLGIIEAIKTFNVDKGTRLTTHALHHIYKQLYLERISGGPIHIPRNMYLKKNINNPHVQSALSSKNTTDDIQYIDEGINDLIEKEHDNYLLAKIYDVFHILTKNQQFVLKERCNGETLKTIGAKIGVTKERVRQIQVAAIEKIRNNTCIRNIKM